MLYMSPGRRIFAPLAIAIVLVGALAGASAYAKSHAILVAKDSDPDFVDASSDLYNDAAKYRFRVTTSYPYMFSGKASVSCNTPNGFHVVGRSSFSGPIKGHRMTTTIRTPRGATACSGNVYASYDFDEGAGEIPSGDLVAKIFGVRRNG